ncbi:hypothetical protein FIBSPDRAFT_855314 [Athelia psychrophila]|uniref:Uncharacterized protein n=1 Tax=Athelia psychrophila TaxID=1759441 RepID=A0A167XNS3_9AGAM|nr:hypothetical protein FIBSPDRAFT_875501 [Fibularhizoctonia sp. CBS 109695]KZP13754.1 hypothetical protein FIBSPDRAFT_869032 [Fibularhizoctonia sp. CBS 109695]KZP26018.1 hypothetical protein FIBSPDRAFT_855314 [Fibularhizoctonia sp. CBS 109695]
MTVVTTSTFVCVPPDLHLYAQSAPSMLFLAGKDLDFPETRKGVPVVSCKVRPVHESLPPTMGLGDENETKQESNNRVPFPQSTNPRRLHTYASDESPGSRSTPPGPPESTYSLL